MKMPHTLPERQDLSLPVEGLEPRPSEACLGDGYQFIPMARSPSGIHP